MSADTRPGRRAYRAARRPRGRLPRLERLEERETPSTDLVLGQTYQGTLPANTQETFILTGAADQRLFYDALTLQGGTFTDVLVTGPQNSTLADSNDFSRDFLLSPLPAGGTWQITLRNRGDI